jgi:hypothetical protein
MPGIDALGDIRAHRQREIQGRHLGVRCGDGTMSHVLEETGCAVPSSDLYERGYGETGHDFLQTQRSDG